MATITRAGLLQRGGRTGVALLLAGPALVVAPAQADAATPSDNDLAYARLFVTAELLAIDFYRRAIDSKHFEPVAVRELRRALSDERKHLRVVAAVLLAAGQAPATPGEIDFVYPRRAFGSSRSTTALGARLESLLLRAYLGAVPGFEANGLKLMAVRIAASEAQHLGAFAGRAGEHLGAALPRPLTIDRASAQLDAFTA